MRIRAIINAGLVLFFAAAIAVNSVSLVGSRATADPIPADADLHSTERLESDVTLKLKVPVNVREYGADGTGRTTMVTRWIDSRTVAVADATGFSEGQEIAICRAAGYETTGSAKGTLLKVADAGIFKVGDAVKVVGGVKAKRQVRTVTVKVAGNAGDRFAVKIDGDLYEYTVQEKDSPATVATALAARITAGKGISAGAKGAVVTIEANQAGVPFGYENIRPTGRGRVSYATLQPNIAQGDFTAMVVAIHGAVLSVSSAVPDEVAGARIEREGNELNTKIVGVSGKVLTLKDPARTRVAGTTVYHNDQPAFALAQAAAARSGGYLYVPAGTYRCTNTLESLHMGNISMVGDGKGKSIIKGLPGNHDLLQWHKSSGVHGVLIKGVTFDRGDRPGSGNKGYIASIGTWRETDYNRDIVVDDVEACNAPLNGIAIYNPRNVRVKGSYFHDAGNGVHFGLYDNGRSRTTSLAYNIWVDHNRFERISGIACNVYGIGNYGDYGLGSYRNVHGNYNDFSHCYMAGWEFYGNCFNSELIGNHASYCGKNSIFGDCNAHGGFSVKYSGEVKIVGNSTNDCYNGVELLGRNRDDAKGFTCNRNILIRDNAFTDGHIGVNVWRGTEGVEIDGNAIYGIDEAGVTVGSRDDYPEPVLDVTIKLNRISGGKWGVLVTPAVRGVKIESNTITNANGWEEESPTRAAICLYGSKANPIAEAVIRHNKLLETRITPAVPQAAPVYARYVVAEVYGNQAAGNRIDAPVMGANGIFTASLDNSWD